MMVKYIGQKLWCEECKGPFEREYLAGPTPTFCKGCSKKAYRKRYASKAKGYQLKFKYGMTVEQFNEILDEQGGACACCGVELVPDGRRSDSAVVDHCHDTGAVRGILCAQCNKMLGFARDNPKVLEKGAEYLRTSTRRGLASRVSDDLC